MPSEEISFHLKWRAYPSNLLRVPFSRTVCCWKYAHRPTPHPDTKSHVKKKRRVNTIENQFATWVTIPYNQEAHVFFCRKTGL